jgi:hypothetical protein
VKPIARSRVDSTSLGLTCATEIVMNEPKKPEAKGFRQDGSKKDEKLPENTKKSLDKKLDHALEETFPTSDPISVKITK